MLHRLGIARKCNVAIFFFCLFVFKCVSPTVFNDEESEGCLLSLWKIVVQPVAVGSTFEG